MPKLMGQDAQQTNKTVHGFQFSAANIEDLGASEYTIVTIVQDKSGSVDHFSTDMEATLQKILEACKKSPRSENLLIRLVTFDDDVDEVHGFTELKTISPGQYSGILSHCNGSTALFDATVNSAEATEAYGKQLSDMDYRNNAVMFIITDGAENASKVIRSAGAIKKVLGKIKTNEIVESFMSVLIGVGDDPDIITYLNQLKDDAGFDQFVEMGKATPSNLAKLASFISKSISSTSQALGTGQPSQPLVF